MRPYKRDAGRDEIKNHQANGVVDEKKKDKKEEAGKDVQRGQEKVFGQRRRSKPRFLYMDQRTTLQAYFQVAGRASALGCRGSVTEGKGREEKGGKRRIK